MSTISKAKVMSISNFGSDVREYKLKLDKNYYFEAGSFLQLTLENIDNNSRWPESRNFSFASAYNNDGIVKLLIRKVGQYTTRIFDELKVGSICTVKYAFGDFLLPFYNKKSTICCIAGGTGIAPILSFVEQLKNEQKTERLEVFYSFKNENEKFGLDVLTDLIESQQLHLFCTQSVLQNTTNRRISINDIRNLNIENTLFYICGNEHFTNYFVSELSDIGCKNIFTDEW